MLKMKLKSIISIFIACILIINIGYFTTANTKIDEIESPQSERMQWPANYEDDAEDLGSVVEIIEEYSYSSTSKPDQEDYIKETTTEAIIHTEIDDNKTEVAVTVGIEKTQTEDFHKVIPIEDDDRKFYSTLFDDQFVGNPIKPINFEEDEEESISSTTLSCKLEKNINKSTTSLPTSEDTTTDNYRSTDKIATTGSILGNILSTNPHKNIEIVDATSTTTEIVVAKKKSSKIKSAKPGSNSNLLHKYEEKLLKDENKFNGNLWKLGWKPFGKFDFYDKKKIHESGKFVNSILQNKKFQYKEFPKLMANNIFG